MLPVQATLQSPGGRLLNTALEEAQRLWERLARGRLHGASRPLKVSADLADLPTCDHAVVYLNAATWTSGRASARFAEEVEAALDAGVHLLLCHEMNGPGQEERLGCEFADFFAHPNGATRA